MAIGEIKAINLKGDTSRLMHYGDMPDTCPICHTSIFPKQITGTFKGEVNEWGSILQVLFQCTKNNCQNIFIGTYKFGQGGSHGYYRFIAIYPKTAKKITFDEEIENISPTFVDVYNQALAAEAEDLTQLTGIGIRKALEFLIKDFLIHQKPSEKEGIEKSFLGNCIEKYIDDNRLKDCASRATWLGNDETHYMRKWNDKDISDLKLLVRLTVSWMETILLTEKYKNVMPK